MCLAIVDKKPKIPKSDIGYKVMLQDTKGVLSAQFYEGRRYKIGNTYKDLRRKNIEDPLRMLSYPTGFHIYKHKEDALRHSEWSPAKPVKVQFSNVVATGTQFNEEVIVARQIKILEVL